MRRRPRNFRVAEVEWTDATTSGGWGKYDVYLGVPLPTIVSVGFLISKTRERLLLVQSVDDLGKCSDSIAIPRGCVRRWHYISR